jgi:imidazolonepropionase-like amidohydrolase
MLRLAAASLFLAASLQAQSVIPNNPGVKTTTAIVHATIYPVTSAPISDATIVMENGVIRALGRDVTIPSGARIIEASGLSVYPGMIDAGTNVGLTEVSSVRGTNDITELGDFNPNARASIAINPNSNVIPVTRVNGITYVVTKPEGGVVSGQGALIRLAGWTPQQMIVRDPVGFYISFPQLSTPSFSDQPQDEEAKKKSEKEYTSKLEQLRNTLRDARAYSKAFAASPRSKTFRRDLILEALVPLVDRRAPAVISANRAADIKAALKFAEEEKIDAILAGGADVQRVLPDLAKKKTPVILGPIYSMPMREDDPYDVIFTNAAALFQAGIPFAIQTDSAHDSRNLPYQAAACAAFGLPKDEALKAVTIYPARIFGVADKIGSLEPGKAASLFVSDGDPLEIRTNIKYLFIDGEEISLETNQTLLYEKFVKRPK